MSVTANPPFSRGDLNCDGLVNNGDIDAFVMALTNSNMFATKYPSCYRLLADMNGDGVANNGDVDAAIAWRRTRLESEGPVVRCQRTQPGTGRAPAPGQRRPPCAGQCLFSGTPVSYCVCCCGVRSVRSARAPCATGVAAMRGANPARLFAPADAGGTLGGGSRAPAFRHGAQRVANAEMY